MTTSPSPARVSDPVRAIELGVKVGESLTFGDSSPRASRSGVRAYILDDGSLLLDACDVRPLSGGE